MSEKSPAEMLRQIEEDVSRIRDRAEALWKVAEAFEQAEDVARAGEITTEARAFELHGREGSGAFPGYFQPTFAAEGGATDPPLAFFTPKRLEHLAGRARASQNPIHAARFADTAWDLGRRDPELAELAAEKYLECLDLYKRNWWDREFEEAASRAAKLAHMLRNEELAARVKERLLAHARKFDASREYEPCLNVASALAGSHRLGLTHEVVGEMLGMLDRASAYYQGEHPAREGTFGAVKGPDEFLVRLAHQIKIVLGNRSGLIDKRAERLEIARSLERQGAARRGTSRLAAISLYERAYSSYRNLSAFADLGRVRVRLREAGGEARGEMPAFEFEMRIPDSAVEEATEHLFCDTPEGTLRAIAGAQSLVPSVERARTDAEEHDRSSIATALMGSRLHLAGGYLARRSASPNEIAESLLADEIVLRATTIYAAMRRHLFGKLVSDRALDAPAFAGYFAGRKLFSEDTVDLLEHGFKHYLAGDHVSALHVLIPRFEAMVRDILNAASRPTADPSSGGALTLGTLLRDSLLSDAAGEDLARYYELALLSPGLGLNLRNGLAHGMLPLGSMDEGNTELVLHLLLTLTRFEPYVSDEQEDPPT